MDRDETIEESADLALAEPPRAVPAGPVVVSVCVTCKISDGGAVFGPDMFAAVQAAIGDGDPGVQVRPVQCLSVCKRPATVAVTSPDGYTFLFGDLQTESGTAALVSGQLEDRGEGGGGGHAWVLSDLKSLLETGSTLAG